MLHSLRFRLSLLLIVAASATLAGFSFYRHNELTEELNENFRSMQAGALERITQVVAVPLWEVNAAALATILRAELTTQDIAALEVQDMNGSTVAAFGRDARGGIVEVNGVGTGSALILERAIVRADNPAERIGRLVIRFTRTHLDATIERDNRQLLLQIVAVNVVLILLLLVSLRVVFAPLAELRQALVRLAGGEGAQAAVTELPEGRYSELARVARAFNLALRRIREESSRQQAKFRDLLESAPDAMIIVNKDGEIVLANLRATSLFGWSREDLLGGKIEMLVPERFRGRHPGHRGGFFAQPHARPMGGERELFGLRKDGAEFPVEISLSPIETQEGLLVAGAIRDVTQRKAAEAALRAANSEQSAIFESATSGIALIRDRVILRCNRKLEEIFGHAPGEFAGKPTRIWYASDEDHARGGSGVYEQVWRGETHRREQQLQRKDGSLFWCRLTGRAVDPADASSGTVWMLEDVTDERAAAEALQEAKRIAEEATQLRAEHP